MVDTTIETVIYSRLTGYAGLSALVSTRVYPSILPQSVTYPAVSFFRVSSERPHAMGVDAGVVIAMYQFDVWASTYTAARQVAKQLILALQRWRTSTGVTVQDAFIEGETEFYEKDILLHHIAVDVTVFYRE